MAGLLATVLAYRLHDPSARPIAVPTGARALGDDLTVTAHGTPDDAIAFAREVLAASATATVGVHVDVLDGEHGPAADGARSLAAEGNPGEILVTDVARQLCTADEQFELAASVRPSNRSTARVHRLRIDRTAPGSPTVGRDVELASIDWVLDQLVDGSGRALVFEGEAGIGKSHLVSVAASRAATRGAAVIRAEADELQPDRPGLLLQRLLDQMVSGPHREELSAESLSDRLQRLATGRPVLVIAEDLQWADPLSLRAVAALARVIEPLPIALIVDHRPTPRPALLGPLVDVMDRIGAERHALGPLDSEATSSLVAAVLGAVPGPALRGRLLGAGGNPLYVTELLQALRDAGSLRVDDGAVDTDADGDIPDRLRDIVRRRVDGLPAASSTVVRDASLLGSSFALDDLAAIVGDPALDVAEALAPAVEALLLTPTGDGFAFRHDLVRSAVQSSIPEAVRRRRHREIAWDLASSGAAPVVVASQLVLSDEPDDPVALEWMAEAAGTACEVDPGAASRLYDVLLTHAPASWDGRDLAEATLVELLATTGKVDEATRRGQEVVRRPVEPGIERVARRGLIAAHAARGHLAAAAGEAEDAAAATPAPDDRLLFRCIAESLRFFDGRSTELSALARELATVDDDDERVAWAEQALGLVAMGDGRYREARAHMVEARRRVDRTPVADLGFLIPHVHAPTMLAYLDDFDGQRDEMGAAEARWASRGEASKTVFRHMAMMNRAYLIGELDSAVAEAEAALAVGAETGADAMLIPSHSVLALVDLARGSDEDAQGHIAAAFEFLFSGAHRYGADLLVLAHTRLSLRHDDTDGAIAGLEQFWGDAGTMVLAFQHRNLLPEIARLGRHGMAPAVVHDAVRAARTAAERTPIASTEGCALRCQGLADGDPDPLLAAVERYRDSPRLVEFAGTLEDAAALLHESGRAEEGVGLADEAESVFRSIGAHADADRVARLGRTSGSSPTGRPVGATHGWESLTPKELEVAELVATGLSNPEIGEELFISRRTVESHLSHIFTKLGIPNRAKLTAIVVERRTATDP